jgi:predicted O-methyltransferase YrrM
MQERKLRVGFVFYPYSGNGASPSEHPAIRNWFVKTVVAAKADPRIQDVVWEDFADTPITMTRNASVQWAKDNEVDVLVMIDSDNVPDLYLGKCADAKPFFQSSFDEIYAKWEQGPRIIGAPYCGHPLQPDGSGGENIFVFLWTNKGSVDPATGVRIEQFTREQAAVRGGIEECAALPTGCIMYDMRAFDLIEEPYFDYEFKGDKGFCDHCGSRIRGPMTEKASTEDVVLTRDISLAGCLKLGYNPVFVNWDAWAGHVKPLTVGKPVGIDATSVSHLLGKAYHDNMRPDVKKRWIGPHPRPEANPVILERPAPVVERSEPAADAFRYAHNTPEEDMQHLFNLVQSEAARLGVLNKPLRIVELGSWVGHSALKMAEACEGLVDYEIHCVDHWNGGNAIQRKAADEHDAYREFCRNVGDRLGKTIIPHRTSTTEGAADWGSRVPEQQPIDILFIDAGHEYDEVLSDIQRWQPYVRPGGLILGHDYSYLFPGVKRAVHETYGYAVANLGTVWAVRLDYRGEAQLPTDKAA